MDINTCVTFLILSPFSFPVGAAISGVMLISEEQEALVGQVFESYLRQHHQEDILQLTADTNEESHCPLFVNAMTLFEANMEVILM